jgi:hypothetical protein
MINVDIILIGIDFCGFKTSSPVVLIASNPIYAKKHLEAPSIMP